MLRRAPVQVAKTGRVVGGEADRGAGRVRVVQYPTLGRGAGVRPDQGEDIKVDPRLDVHARVLILDLQLRRPDDVIGGVVADGEGLAYAGREHLAGEVEHEAPVEQDVGTSEVGDPCDGPLEYRVNRYVQ